MNDVFTLSRVFTDEMEVALHSVYDGDTFFIDIPDIPEVFGERISVRINRIDAPEMDDERPEVQEIAVKAKERLEEVLQSGTIILKNVRRGKYFRLLAEVKVKDEDVGQLLLEEDLVREYKGRGIKPWTVL